MRKLLLMLTAGCVALTSAATALAADPPPAERFVILARSSEVPDFSIPPLLDREMMRQALLMAARDDLGLWTRDEVLDEAMPQVQSDLAARKISLNVAVNNGAAQIHLKFSPPQGKPMLLDVVVPALKSDEFPNLFIPDLSKLAAKAEELSRGQFSDWLKQSGFGDAKAKPIAHDETIPKEIETRLTELTIFSQFAAIRAAHQTIADHGPSRAMLEVLARGYANLGQITRFHWTESSEVFAARSLLYAQRLVNSDPNLAIGRWTRAYASAFAGLHYAALADLDAVKGTDGPPPWVKMLDGLCRYDTPKLLDLAATVDRQYMVLCEFMAYLTVEHAECYDLYKQAGKFILEATPFCDRVSDSLCSRFVGDDLSALTANLLSNTVELYRIELPRIADLPHSVAISWEAAHKNTDLAADIANVSRAFVDATEESEPSWSALGNMLQETNFSQTYQRMWSMTMGYASGDPNEFAADAKKLVQGNSCAALIDGMLAKHQNQPLPSALQNINLPFPSFHYPLNDPWDILGKDRKEWDSFWNLTWDHFDATAWDCEDNLVWFKFKPDPSPQVFSHADMLSVLSPFSPNGAAWRIRTIYLKKPADQAVKELERRFADKTAVAAAASYYFSLNYKFADAIIPLQAFAKQSQDPSYYEELAYCYLQTGDENHWLSAMEEGISIAIDDSTKAKMNSSIALQLLGEGKYEKAMQYGDSAVQFGQTGDTLANSLVIAGPCHAAMGDFKTADDLINKLPDQDSSWDTSVYYWRRVTGRGDLDAIRKAALVSFGSQPEGIDAAGICHGEGDSANERRILQAMYDKQPVAYYGLSLLLLDYKAGNQDAVDRTLTTLQKNFTLWQEFEYHKAFQEAVRWIERERGFQNGKSGKPFDREPVAEVLANLRKYSETNRVDVEFVIGEYLLTEGGNNEQALALLRDTAMFSPISSYSGFIARLDLAKRHIDPFHPNAPATRPAAHPGL